MIMLKERILSYGSKLEFSYRCPDCGKWNGYSLNLQELLEKEQLKVEPYKTDVPVRLELSSGDVVEINYSNGRMERWLRSKREPDIIDLTMAQVVSVNAETPKRSFFENLPSSDLDKIRTLSDELTGGLNPTFELECSECDSVFIVPFGSIPDFFIQRRTKQARHTV